MKRHFIDRGSAKNWSKRQNTIQDMLIIYLLLAEPRSIITLSFQKPLNYGTRLWQIVNLALVYTSLISTLGAHYAGASEVEYSLSKLRTYSDQSHHAINRPLGAHYTGASEIEQSQNMQETIPCQIEDFISDSEEGVKPAQTQGGKNNNNNGRSRLIHTCRRVLTLQSISSIYG